MVIMMMIRSRDLGGDFGKKHGIAINQPAITKLTFLYLQAFSMTGGIEKVNRVLMKALWDLQQKGQWQALAVSPYSDMTDTRYFPQHQLWGFRGSRWRFMLHMFFRPPKTDVLLVGHINLAPAALLFHFRYPRMKMVVMAHGIEVWSPLRGLKKWMLRRADSVLSVSEFTKHQLVEVHGLDAQKVVVLPNCIDPYFQLPREFRKPDYLLKRYSLLPSQKVLLTISRITISEGNKGYDQVLECIPALIIRYPDLQYMLAGRCDQAEKRRLETIIERLNLKMHVHLPGYIPDSELSDYYQLADVFVMPSKKEGFGIVFIEAMACGTPAIGGDQDGSLEALRPDLLGYTTNPDDVAAIISTISRVLNLPQEAKELQRKTMETFGYENYRARLAKALQF